MKRLFRILMIPVLVTAVSDLNASGLLPALGGQRVATSAFSFLKIDPSVTASGFHHAGVTLGMDAASALYWNPASIIQLNSFSASLTHTDWFTGISYDYGAAVLPLTKNNALGISAGVLHMDPMEITSEYKPYGTGEYFNFRDAFVTLAWSRRMSDRFSFGISAKYVEESYLDLKTSSVLMDLGTWYFTGYRDLRIAVSLLHFGAPVKPDGTVFKTDLDGNVYEDEYEDFSPPTSFQLGTFMTLYSNPFLKVKGIFQLNHPVDNAETYVFAGETELLNSFSLRFGYDVTDSEAPLSFGFGLHPGAWKKGLSIDYSYMEHPWLENVQQFQINFYFGK